MSMDIDELESELKRRLADLRAEYHRRAEQIIDELVKLQNLKPRPPIIIPKEALNASSLAAARFASNATPEDRERFLSGDFGEPKGAIAPASPPAPRPTS